MKDYWEPGELTSEVLSTITITYVLVCNST